MNTKEFNKIIEQIHRAPVVALDTETTGLNVLTGEHVIIGVSLFVPHTGLNTYLPIGHDSRGEFLALPEDGAIYTKSGKVKSRFAAQIAFNEIRAARPLPPNLTDGQILELDDALKTVACFIMHNAPFDCWVLEWSGFGRITAPIYDTAIMAYCYNSSWGESQFEAGALDRQEWDDLDSVFSGSIVGEAPEDEPVKYERGNKRLKWLAQHFNIPHADDGEASLNRAARELGQEIAKRAGVKSFKIDPKKHLWSLPFEVVEYYAKLDTFLTWHLCLALHPRLADFDLLGVNAFMSEVQQNVTMRMTRNGFQLDTGALEQQLEAGQAELEETQAQIVGLFGYDVNPNSSQQVAQALLLAGVKLANTQKETLKSNLSAHPAIGPILHYRAVSKLISGYLKKWQDYSIVRPEYNVGGTITARLSASSDTWGNLQNIPRDVNSQVAPKNLLLPPVPGWVLVELDYKTLEIRIAAWIAEHLMGFDKNFTLSNIGVGDMHTYTMNKANIPFILLGNREPTAENIKSWYQQTGKTVPNMPDDELIKHWIKKEARMAAKIVNFASMYGGGANAIQKPLGIGRDQAQAIAQGWRNTYPAIPEATRILGQLAGRPRSTPSGKGQAKFIAYPDIGGWGCFIRNYTDVPQRMKDENGAVWSPLDASTYKTFNSMVQGVAGLVCLNSAARVARMYRDSSFLKIVATVHDSLILAVHPHHLDAIYLIQDMMTDYDIKPGLEIDIEACAPGASWGSKKSVSNIEEWVALNGKV